MNVGGALKDIRVNVDGRRQQEIARVTGISQTYLSQIEAGKRSPTQEVIERLCSEYKVPVAFAYWKGMETEDIHKTKQRAFGLIKPIVDDLITGFLVNNYK